MINAVYGIIIRVSGVRVPPPLPSQYIENKREFQDRASGRILLVSQ